MRQSVCGEWPTIRALQSSGRRLTRCTLNACRRRNSKRKKSGRTLRTNSKPSFPAPNSARAAAVASNHSATRSPKRPGSMITSRIVKSLAPSEKAAAVCAVRKYRVSTRCVYLYPCIVSPTRRACANPSCDKTSLCGPSPFLPCRRNSSRFTSSSSLVLYGYPNASLIP